MLNKYIYGQAGQLCWGCHIARGLEEVEFVHSVPVSFLKQCAEEATLNLLLINESK